MSDRTPNLTRLVPLLLNWFSKRARDLPWRRTRDPYAIWVSEVMLQQTQVKTVISYWERWMRELPTIRSVVNASPDKIHKLWEGLGYYTRVRNLQKAAQQIVAREDAVSKSSRSRGLSRRSETQTDNASQAKKELETPSAFARLRRDKHVVSYKFPEKFDDVLALPGIGRYTAGAICSIAFNQPVPILDGNVIRVLTRIFGIGENPREKMTNARLWRLAEELVIHAKAHRWGETTGEPAREDARPTKSKNCSHLNQSLMELGALVCIPRNPQCKICPVKKLCVAFQENRVNALPNLGKRETTTARHFVAFVAERNGRFLVRQRPADVVNAHLWEFPNVEILNGKLNPELTAKNTLGVETPGIEPFCTVKHSITRYRMTLEAFYIRLKKSPQKAAGVWQTPAQMDRLAFTAAHLKILHALAATGRPHRVVRSSAFRRPA